MKDGSRRAAAQGDFSDVILSPEGTKEDFVAEVQGLDLGSDHQVLGDSTFAIPTLYFHDWPDIYIHTNKDLPEMLDATKLQRIAFLGAATGYTLANLDEDDTTPLLAESSARASRRLGTQRGRAMELLLGSEGADVHAAYREASNRLDHAARWERKNLASIAGFTASDVELEPWFASLDAVHRGAVSAARTLYEELCRRAGLAALPESALEPKPTAETSRIPKRSETVRGPTSVYYYDYLEDKLGATESPLSGAVRYEILNFVDGRRTVQEIRDAVSAELDPVAIDDVIAHLEMLERADVVRFQD